MTHDSEAELLEHLLQYYSFELGGLKPDEWVAQWRDRYPQHWLRSAIVEALYQGRYKVISVAQILDMWERRGQSVCHYNGEFERMVCNKFLPLTFSESAARATSTAAHGSMPVPDETPLPIVNADSIHGDGAAPEVSSAPESHPAATPLKPFAQADSHEADSDPVIDPVIEERRRSPTDESALSTVGAAQITPLEPEISLLEDEFLEIFAVESNPFQESSIPPQAIPPFKPNADVPMAASRFADESIAEDHTPSSEGATVDVYSKLKAALGRVVSTTKDED